MNPHDCGQGLVRDFGLAYAICMVNYLRVVDDSCADQSLGYRLAGLNLDPQTSRETILVAEDQRM
jgi:hypothetical protein